MVCPLGGRNTHEVQPRTRRQDSPAKTQRRVLPEASSTRRRKGPLVAAQNCRNPRTQGGGQRCLEAVGAAQMEGPKKSPWAPRNGRHDMAASASAQKEITCQHRPTTTARRMIETTERAEDAVGQVQSKARTPRAQTEAETKTELVMQRQVAAWFVRWAGEILSSLYMQIGRASCTN